MGKPGRPVSVVLNDGDRERARDNLKRLERTWNLSGGDLAVLLGTSAGVIAAIRNVRITASSAMIARALALDDADIAISPTITARKVRAQKLAAHLEQMRIYNAQFDRYKESAPPLEPAAPHEPKPEREEDKDIPFT